MGEPKQGSTAWYQGAADKLKDFTKKAQAHIGGDHTAFDDSTILESEEASGQVMSRVEMEAAKIQYDALNR